MHPNNNQVPGVCSSCLRDKLLKLSSNNEPALSTFSSSLNYESPAYRRRHRRHTSNVVDPVSSMISFDYGLKKSNSIAFASTSFARDREVNGSNRGSKKGSIWSKLLKLTRKNTKEPFMHSTTSRDGKS
ncbi:uncharacterized protein LOC113873703 [Abrus precatorius]|uniref:Uncharacterized protein LOC113873703 n=1 Tax=Abrus precatorius TaxID=3816 RepID=A0A8B8MJJ2_ABRPR|nr:uncharacterized protein LOC113873703 [Abrus precatorius]